MNEQGDDESTGQWQSSTLRRLQSPVDAAEETSSGQTSDEATTDAHTTADAEDPPSVLVTGVPPQVHRRLSQRPATGAVKRGAARLRSIVRDDSQPTALVATWNQVQTPLATGRRVMVLPAHGGVGATTLTLCVGQLLHRHRRDGIAVIEASDRRGGLLSRLAQEPLAAVEHIANDVSAMPSTGASGHEELTVLAPGTDDPNDAYEVATRLRRTHALTITDAAPGGTIAHPEDLDALVIVAHNSVRSLAAAEGCRQQALEEGVLADQVMIAIVACTWDSGLSSHRALAHLHRRTIRAVQIGADRHLAGAAAIDPELLAANTVLDFAHLGAQIVTIAATPR